MAAQCFVLPAPSCSFPGSRLPQNRTLQKRSRQSAYSHPQRQPPVRPTPLSPSASARFSATGEPTGGGNERKLGPRPDGIEPPPPFLPQTMEYAIRQAQYDVSEALLNGETRLTVELPMGRSRKHWYRMSPLSMWYTEAATHALHFAEMFQGLRICIVFGCDSPDMQADVPWIADARRIEDSPPPPPDSLSDGDDKDKENADGNKDGDTSGQIVGKRESGKGVLKGDAARTVVIIAAATAAQRKQAYAIAESAGWAEAVIFLNCFLDMPLSNECDGGFRTAYACRAFDKVAVLRRGTRAAWSVFVEIAVFEFEWVGDRDCLVSISGAQAALGQSEDVELWVPTQNAVEQFAIARGASRRAMSAYYETGYSGCEAGFWPFMTLACRDVMPLDGAAMAREADAREAKKKSTKPFGFF